MIRLDMASMSDVRYNDIAYLIGHRVARRERRAVVLTHPPRLFCISEFTTKQE